MDTLGARVQVSWDCESTPSFRRSTLLIAGSILAKLDGGGHRASLLHLNATQSFLGEPHEQHASTLCAVVRIISVLLQPTGHLL